MMQIRPLGMMMLALSLASCSRAPPPARPEPALPASASPMSFVDTVWRVRASSTVAPGTLYVFLSEGTLVIASEGNKPLLGTWHYENGQLTMVEESIPYRIEVLSLTGDEFRIRSHNPGEPVDITLIRADQ